MRAKQLPMSESLDSTTKQRRIANLRPWQPGQSGNPSGFSGIHGEVRRLATQASPEAIMALVEIMRASPDDRCRIVAAQAILDRAGMTPPKRKEEESECPKFDLSSYTPAEINALRAVFADIVRRSENRTDSAVGND